VAEMFIYSDIWITFNSNGDYPLCEWSSWEKMIEGATKDGWTMDTYSTDGTRTAKGNLPSKIQKFINESRKTSSGDVLVNKNGSPSIDLAQLEIKFRKFLNMDQPLKESILSKTNLSPFFGPKVYNKLRLSSGIFDNTGWGIAAFFTIFVVGYVLE